MIDQDKSNIAVVIAKCFNNTGITLIEQKIMIIDKINKLKAVSQSKSNIKEMINQVIKNYGNIKTNEKQTIPVSGFFVAIGHQPNSEIFKEWLDMDDAGYIKTIPGSSKTNIEAVFAAGDVQDKIYRQAVTAAGSGCMAALDAERYLSAKGLV